MNCTLLRYCFNLRSSARRKTQSHRRVDVSTLEVLDDVQTLIIDITSKLDPIKGYGSLDEPWMGLKVSIIDASLQQLAKANWRERIGYFIQYSKAIDTRRYNSPDCHDLCHKAARPKTSNKAILA